MWIIYLEKPIKAPINILVTDQPLLHHYLTKKYYLNDPNMRLIKETSSSWKMTFGSNCKVFNKSGFLYDLYKLFHIEEFVSIENKIDSAKYCFRFFTKNNRFVFASKLLNNVPLIKHFIKHIAEKFKENLQYPIDIGSSRRIRVQRKLVS